MFPKNKINIMYRILCLICFIGVILFINNEKTLFILLIIYSIFSLSEKNFRNIELIVISLIVLFICRGLKNYLLFRIMLSVDYSIYFLETLYCEDEIEEANGDIKRYVRFANQKKKGINNISAIYVTLHLVLLMIAIVVG